MAILHKDGRPKFKVVVRPEGGPRGIQRNRRALHPELVRYIASVIAAYRVVKAITSLVDTEADSENEWLPLQKQWKYVTDLLEDIAKGRLKLPLEESHPDREDPSFVVVTKEPFFDLRGL